MSLIDFAQYLLLLQKNLKFGPLLKSLIINKVTNLNTENSVSKRMKNLILNKQMFVFFV